VICGSCGAEVTGAARQCPGCHGETALAGRYRLEAVLGQGAMGTTYRATRLEDERVLCVKELRYGRVGSFEAEKLFRREAALLRQLSHPAIPAYVDDFAAGEGKAFSLYLVQEHVAGRTLKQELEGHRYGEAEVLAIIDELLDVLAYLHGRSPPVIHRDLKPSNVIRREADGRLVLVDFGAARDAVREGGGSTIAGTFGYMAPEQFRGEATPATDLYGLGALAVGLLARRDPAAMLTDDHRLAWRPHLRVGPRTQELLDLLLALDPTLRPPHALAAARLVRLAADAVAGMAALTAAPAPPPPAALLPPPAPAAVPAPASDPATDALAPPAPAGAPRRSGFERLVLAGGLALAGLATATLLLLRPAPPAPRRPPLAAVATPGPARPRGHFVADRQPASAPASRPAVELLPPTCDGAPCEPLPRGLKGARFGMTPAEIRATFPGGAEELEPAGLGPAAPDGGAAVDVNAPRLRVAISYAGEPATCTLVFAVEGRLSQMICLIEHARTLPQHRALQQTVLKALRTRYGQDRFAKVGLVDPLAQRRSFARDVLNDPRRGLPHRASVIEHSRWEWWDEAARFELRGEYSVAGQNGRSLLEIRNTSTAHEALLRTVAPRAADAADDL
jgi:hypothetical protein